MKHYKITDTWYQKVDGPDVLDINFRDKYPSIMGGTDRDPLGERLGNEITKEEFEIQLKIAIINLTT